MNSIEVHACCIGQRPYLKIRVTPTPNKPRWKSSSLDLLLAKRYSAYLRFAGSHRSTHAAVRCQGMSCAYSVSRCYWLLSEIESDKEGKKGDCALWIKCKPRSRHRNRERHELTPAAPFLGTCLLTRAVDNGTRVRSR